MFTFSPSLQITLGRSKGKDKEKPSELQNVMASPPAPVGQVDPLLMVMMILAVAIVLLSATVFVYAARR